MIKIIQYKFSRKLRF